METLTQRGLLYRQVLIDLGPSYFKYMEATASRPTVLAKLLGFYTVEIRNLETGNTQAKADLLVMKNLFYNQNITKTFDLKGIQGRKVKASGGANSKTLFDGEWIEGDRNPGYRYSKVANICTSYGRSTTSFDPRKTLFEGRPAGSHQG